MNMENLGAPENVVTTAPAASVLDGWTVAPLVPTEMMLHAAEDVPAPRPFGAVYRAMLEAMPIYIDPRLVAAAETGAPAAPAAPVAATTQEIKVLKDLLLWPVTEDDAKQARDILQSLHFDLSMAKHDAEMERLSEYNKFYAAYRDISSKEYGEGSENMIRFHADRHWGGWPGKMWLARAALAAPQQHAQAAQNNLALRQDFLNWNRQQDKPPVVVSYEYGVFDKVAEMIASQSDSRLHGNDAQAALSDDDLSPTRFDDVRDQADHDAIFRVGAYSTRQPAPVAAAVAQGDTRAAFEAWFGNSDPQVLQRSPKHSEQYRLSNTQYHWNTWQAALTAQPPADAAPVDAKDELVRSGLSLMVELKKVKDEHVKMLEDVYSALLWMHRRLPLSYKPFAGLYATIESVGSAIGHDAREALAEKAAQGDPLSQPTTGWCPECHARESTDVSEFEQGRAAGIEEAAKICQKRAEEYQQRLLAAPSATSETYRADRLQRNEADACMSDIRALNKGG